ncbi:MAG: hypothetical protein MUD04_12105 [Cyanobium sp. Prado107]|jgi:hypothetical protein|nr:hypothetical protein [Cyanobium sp. Prado107]
MAWEYRVIHIDVSGGSPPEPPSPEADSRRLGGALSPEFLEREFPQQYLGASRRPRHPAEQLQFFLNALGRENWELVEAPQVGPLLMFVFKRPALELPQLPPGGAERGSVS